MSNFSPRHTPTKEENIRLKRKRNRLYAVTLAILMIGSVWLSALGGIPAAPTISRSPSDSLSSQEPLQPLAWNYPTSTYSIVVDDFSLGVDGSFLLQNDYAPGGLSQGYLENCMQLSPSVPFTVESLGEGKFRVILENGTNLLETTVTLPGDPKKNPAPEPFVAQIKPHLAVRLDMEKGNDGAPIDRPFAIQFSKDMAFPENLENLITFSPPLSCKMEVKDNQIVVTPSQMMEYGAYYAVQVSPRLVAQSGDAFADAQMLEFSAELRDFSISTVNQGVSTIAPEHAIKTQYQLDTAGHGGRIGTVELLSIGNTPAASFDAYVTFLKSYPLQGMRDGGKQVSELANPEPQLPTTMIPIKNWTGSFSEGLSTVSLENPGAGFYLLRTTVTDTKTKEPVVSYRPIQVTSPVIYLQSCNGENLFWLNDSITGKPLANHTIRFLRRDFEAPVAAVTTDNNGVAKLPLTKPIWEEEYTEEASSTTEKNYWSTLQPNKMVPMSEETAIWHNQSTNVFVVYDAKEQPVYVDATASLSRAENQSNRYYSFFYLDRALYRPTDEIQFWGYLKPYAENPAPLPQTLTVHFDPEGLNQQVDVTVKADGTYTGTLRLDKVLSAEYEVRVQYATSQQEQDIYTAMYHSQPDPFSTLETTWIQVNEFQKAAYTIEAAVDRPLYRWGDEIAVTVTPSFFDGTPAPYMPLECSVFNPSTGNLDATTKLETDGDGKVVYRFRAGDCLTFDSDQDWTPKRAYFYIKITTEGENVTYQGHYNYLPGEYAIRPTVEMVGEDNAQLTILANKITLDNVHSEEDLDGLLSDLYYRDTPNDAYDLLLGEPVDLTMDVDLDIYYCRPYDGSYDEIYYDYTDHQRFLAVEVRDGKAVVEKLVDVPCREGAYLSVYADASYPAASCTVSSSTSANNGKQQYYSAEDAKPKGYSFHVYRNDEKEPAQARESYMIRDTLEAGVGDQLRFALAKDGQEVPISSGKLFYSIIQGNVLSYGVTGETLSLTQKQSNANNILLVGAYFDGKTVFPIVNCEVTLGTESLRLNVETTADQEAYLPGSQATVTAKITDQKGNPVQTSLCLSIVDEAVFALREQSVDLLSELYRNLTFPTYFINKYTTSTGDLDPYLSGGDGGKGDGENLLAYDIFRKNFKDTALFLPTTSDAQGIATAKFTLPDNLTSWRVTTLAIDPTQQGGQNRSTMITSMPFFIKPVLSSKYLAGDEIAMLLRGYGTAVGSEDLVDYSITIQGNGVENTQSYQKKAGELLDINFGVLPEGEYTVIATGKFGDRRDTVELPLSIIHSNLELTLHKVVSLDGPLEVPNSRYPVTLTFYHEQYQAYYECLSLLLQHHCQRLDQRMARLVAQNAFAKTASDALPSNLRPEDTLSEYQRADGGIGWNPQDYGWENDGSQPELTVRAYLVAPEQFSSDRIRRYLLQVTDDSSKRPVEHAAAWAGLAAIDPSFAGTIQERLASAKTLEEQLWYAIGLAYAGDLNSSEQFYNDQIVPKLDTRGQMICFAQADKNDQLVNQTALAWVIATKLKLPDADGYANYFTSQGWMGGALFEAMLYVENSPVTPQPIQFTFRGGNREGTIDLSKAGSQSITLGRDALENLSFQNVPEGVLAMAYYVGEPEESNLLPANAITIEKQVTPLENGKYENVLRVSLAQDAVYGQYTISDWIPSNSRLHSIKNGTDKMTHSHTQEGQKLYFQMYYAKGDSGTWTITYYTQRAYSSAAVQDRTYLIAADTGETAFTERGVLE